MILRGVPAEPWRAAREDVWNHVSIDRLHMRVACHTPENDSMTQ